MQKAWMSGAAVLVSILALVAVLQWKSGAWSAELGGHPDEAAHFVTTVMVRDYLANGHGSHPMRFAEAFYDHYPKVALGHYPPGLYAVGAVWALCLGMTTASMLGLQAVLCTALCGLLYAALRRQVGSAAACAAGVICAMLPLVQEGTQLVMADLLVALLAFAAILCWAAFLERGRALAALAFGGLAAATILTKTSGLWLAPIPAVTVLISGRWQLLKRVSFWSPAVIVVAAAAPWTYITYGMMAEGMVEKLSASYAFRASQFFTVEAIRAVGFPLALLAGVGLCARIILPLLRRKPPEPLWCALAALPFSIVVFHTLVPVGFESRYVLPAVPAIIALAAAGAVALAEWLAARTRPSAAPKISGAAAGLLALAFLPAMPAALAQTKIFSGFGPLAREVAARPEEKVVLISSDACGEGAFIAELVQRESRPGHTVRRSSKLLASSDWMGRDYALAFKTEDELIAGLDQAKVQLVALETEVPSETRVPHHELLVSAVKAHPERWEKIVEAQVYRPHAWKGGMAVLYRLKPAGAE